MSLKTDTFDKLYYSISEAARITGLEPYVLRYWEKEFPTLRPRKTGGGNRMYTQKDIELINHIKHLRSQEKLTIAGARNKLTLHRQGEQEKGTTTGTATAAKAKTLIGRIRAEVEDLLKLFP